jgi:hypothetical protein
MLTHTMHCIASNHSTHAYPSSIPSEPSASLSSQKRQYQTYHPPPIPNAVRSVSHSSFLSLHSFPPVTFSSTSAVYCVQYNVQHPHLLSSNNPTHTSSSLCSLQVSKIISFHPSTILNPSPSPSPHPPSAPVPDSEPAADSHSCFSPKTAYSYGIDSAASADSSPSPSSAPFPLPSPAPSRRWHSHHQCLLDYRLLRSSSREIVWSVLYDPPRCSRRATFPNCRKT